MTNEEAIKHVCILRPFVETFFRPCYRRATEELMAENNKIGTLEYTV